MDPMTDQQKATPTQSPAATSEGPVQAREPVPVKEDSKPDPHYAYAGANAGGQALYVCGVCSALMQEDHKANHTKWHHQMGN